MPASGRNDPYAGCNFLVEIDGLTAAGFAEVGGLESETEVIEYREGSDSGTVRKLSGLTKYANITLKRGISSSTELHDWRKQVIDGQVARKNGSIVLLDDQRQEVARWNFQQGWPCRLAGPALNAGGNEVAIEELEICHEGLERA